MANYEGLFTLKDLKEAQQSFQELKSRDPDDPALLWLKGFSSQLAGRQDVSKKHFTSFIQACIRTYGNVPSAVSHYKTRLDNMQARGLDEKHRDVVFTKMMIAKLEAPATEKTYDTRPTEEPSSCVVA